jgi:integrase/recombinase XerD
MSQLPASRHSRGLQERAASLEDLVQAFLRDQDIKASSKATYERSLRQFVAWLEETGRADRLADLQREDLLEYKSSLVDRDLSAYSISLYLTAVRRLFQWLEAKKVYPNVARGVKGARKPHGHRKDVLSPEELRLALAGIDRSTLTGLRDYAILNLLARTGLRTVEVSRALIGDIRQEPGLQPGERVLWIQGKGRDAKDELVVLTEETLAPIEVYLEARGQRRTRPSRPLFASESDRNYGGALSTRSISRIVKRALRRVGLDDARLTAHSMRHTAITLAILGGATPQQAQAMARHTDIKVTLAYFHNLNRVEAAAERAITF